MGKAFVTAAQIAPPQREVNAMLSARSRAILTPPAAAATGRRYIMFSARGTTSVSHGQ
jgi:hypothetical protein